MLNYPYRAGVDPYDPSGPILHIKIKDMPNAIILVGIPTSGKSTWASKTPMNQHIICRDEIRYHLFGKKYKQNPKDEYEVTRVFDYQLNQYVLNGKNIILDNCHCRKSYIILALRNLEAAGYTVRIKFFDIPLWKAFYRNVKRKIFTGKWIPWNVIKNMKANYDKIDKSKYSNYLYDPF